MAKTPFIMRLKLSSLGCSVKGFIMSEHHFPKGPADGYPVQVTFNNTQGLVSFQRHNGRFLVSMSVNQAKSYIGKDWIDYSNERVFEDKPPTPGIFDFRHPELAKQSRAGHAGRRTT